MPDFHIDGDPGAVRARATTTYDKGQLFFSTGEALSAIDTSGWTGRAADHFREAHQLEPERWYAAGNGFRTAGTALQTYAGALEQAQQTAAWAQGEYERGEQVTRDARAAYDADVADARQKLAAGMYSSLTVVPFDDPGQAIRDGAVREFGAAKASLDEAAHVCAGQVRAGCAAAPEQPHWWESGLKFVGGIFQGAGEAVWDLLTISPFGLVNQIEDTWKLASGDLTPEELAKKYELSLETVGDMWNALQRDPVEFGKNLGKGLLDWDTWSDDPARAIGHLVPDAVAAVFTAGAGTVATRGAKGVADLAEGLRTFNRISDFKHLDEVSDFGDFRTVEGLERADPAVVGPWDGAGDFVGKHLDPPANAAATDYLAGARHVEPEVSGDMRRIEDATGTRLEGYDFRLKGDESFRSKMYDAMTDRQGDADSSLRSMKDSIRYTFTAEDGRFADKVGDVRHSLSEAGYTELKFKNTFGGDGYQGINAAYQSPHGGGTIEVQFHTPESFEAKMQSHDLYDQLKGKDVDPHVRADVTARSDALFSQVRQPEGVSDLMPARTNNPWNLHAGGMGAAGAHLGVSADRMEQP